MTIDLSGWNEYVIDDIYSGKIPQKVNIQVMQILVLNSKIELEDDYLSKTFGKDIEFVEKRLFWRYLSDETNS